ncbi:MAG TPA: putative peptidoglycan glycosyltransferase FtsW [Capsulimonadaceae bacterium]|jgi:cell division protein FtsW
MATRTGTRRKTDIVLLVVTLMLTCLGVLLIFDASYAYALQIHAKDYKYVLQQSIWAGVGIIAMLIVRRVHYDWFNRNALYIVGFCMLLLVCVFIPHIGAPAVNGAKRWVGTASVKFQPSELAKLAIVLYVARLCAGRPRIMQSFKAGPLAPVVVLGIFAILVEREPDLGTTLVILGSGIGALCFAGLKKRHLAGILAVALVCIAGALWMKSNHAPAPDPAAVASAAENGAVGRDYRNSRIYVFLHPNESHTGEGYQVYHSMIALGTGGLVGLGLGNGRQKYYLPEAHTDFILATLAEEGGLIATLFVLLLFAVLVGRGLHIASMTRDPFAAIVAGGISASFAVQALLNIAVVTSSVPATGVPLPFLSYGGTSLVISLINVGILLSIYRNSEWDDDGRSDIAKSAPDRDFDRRWNRGNSLLRPEYARGGTYRGSKGYRDTNKASRPKSPVV